MPSLEEIYAQFRGGSNQTTPAPKEQVSAEPVEDKNSLESIYSQFKGRQTAPSQQSGGLTVDIPQPSPLKWGDRLFMATFTDRSGPGAEEFLRQKFSYVARGTDGRFLAGNDPKTAAPIDPDGIAGDVLGETADFVGAAAPQLAALGAIPLTGGASLPIQMGAAGLIAGATKAATTTVGSAMGFDKRTLLEKSGDIGLETAFGAGGPAIDAGLKQAGQLATAKIASNIFKNLPEKGKEMMAGIFKLTTGKESVKYKFAMDNIDDIYRAGNGTDGHLIKIIDEFKDKVTASERAASNQVGSAVNELGKKAKGGIETGKLQQAWAENMASINAIDYNPASGTFTINKLSTDPKRAELVKIFQSLGGQPTKGSDGRIIKDMFTINQKARINPELLQHIKSAQLSPIMDNVIKMEGRPQFVSAVAKIKSSIGGALDETADALGVPLKQANARMANIEGILTQLRQTGLNVSSDKAVENFIRGASDSGPVIQGLMGQLDQSMGLAGRDSMLHKFNVWDTARDFRGINPNLFRFNTMASMAAGGYLAGMQDSPLGKAAAFGAAIALGTPAGVGRLIQVGSKAGRALSRASNVKNSINSPAKTRTAIAAINSMILEQQRRQSAVQPVQSNKNQVDKVAK